MQMGEQINLEVTLNIIIKCLNEGQNKQVAKQRITAINK